MGIANRTIKSSDGAVLPLWEFLGGETLTVSGQSDESVVANLPDGAEIFHAVAEGGATYYSFSPIASATSPGYIPEDQRVIEGPIRDLTGINGIGLSFYIAAAGSVHVAYYRENTGR